MIFLTSSSSIFTMITHLWMDWVLWKTDSGSQGASPHKSTMCLRGSLQSLSFYDREKWAAAGCFWVFSFHLPQVFPGCLLFKMVSTFLFLVLSVTSGWFPKKRRGKCIFAPHRVENRSPDFLFHLFENWLVLWTTLSNWWLGAMGWAPGLELEEAI